MLPVGLERFGMVLGLERFGMVLGLERFGMVLGLERFGMACVALREIPPGGIQMYKCTKK